MLKKTRKGFTLIEVLTAITILGMLSVIVFVSIRKVKERTYSSRVEVELNSFVYALKMYATEHGGNFPDDVNRDLPSGIESYLSTGLNNWPDAPWPGSVYDWDNWTIEGEAEPIYQISIRFCINGVCSFPNEPWAEEFEVNSAYYYCISGSCRAHRTELTTYPGYCSNCEVQPSES
jgi:prepilin-type N-terminal cleavage/methylation domain-containing protein